MAKTLLSSKNKNLQIFWRYVISFTPKKMNGIRPVSKYIS